MKIIICDYFPWDIDFRDGSHHFGRLFLDNGWEVLWISQPVSFLHGMKPENAGRMERAKAGPYQHRDGPLELVPYTLLPIYNAPLLSSSWVYENSHRYFQPSLERSLNKAGFSKPDLVWITNMVMHPVAEIADAKAVALRIADENVEFKNVPRAQAGVEDRLARTADTVFVTSSPLEDKLRKKFGSKVHLLRNGVEYEHFQGEFERPADFRGIEGPIAIYIGAIQEWFAVDWVEKLARSREDLTVVLIGKPQIDLGVLRALKNVRILGPKPYEKLPAYLAHSDCGIIPFKRTKLVESVSPLKLFEYFAAGIPAVCTRWLELERLDSPAMLASYDAEFAQNVLRMIEEKWKKQRGEQFRAFARENSWKSRYSKAMSVLERYIR